MFLYGSAYLKRRAGWRIGKRRNHAGTAGEILQELGRCDSARGKAKPGYKTMLDAVYRQPLLTQRALDEGKAANECLKAMARGCSRRSRKYERNGGSAGKGQLQRR